QPGTGRHRPAPGEGVWRRRANPARSGRQGHDPAHRHAGEEGGGARRLRSQHRRNPSHSRQERHMRPSILIVEARFYSHIADLLLDGATAALDAAGGSFERVSVPGSLEIPTAIAFAAKAGDAGGKGYDGYVALGTVLRGETYHFEVVANESARALMDL